MKKKLLKRFLLGTLVLTVGIPSGLVYRQYREDMSLAYQRLSSGAQYIETACGPLQYTEFGDGAPMLIVHGAGGGYDQGEYFARLIGGNYRWISPSRFGFLATPAPDEANSSLQADAYACLLDTLGIDRVGVVGVSMGGPSALLFALQYQQRTKSLVMISAASHAIPSRPAVLAALFKVFLNDFIYWAMVKLSPSGLLVALGVPMEVQKQLSAEDVTQLHAFLESIKPMGARRNGQLLEQQMSEYDAGQIPKIQAPTLVMHAPDDTLISIEQGEFTAKNIPGAQFITMEKGGHLALLFTMNAGAREKLREFLERYNIR
ncbi:MAG: alpha/beta hydrolase [Proteobacteria bacterium]|nr:alpha/beta hydrolase [Pseudomonadota bacterium]MBU1061036.1 alpha/beta hydrolase [Pseudomonadota bacterium]